MSRTTVSLKLVSRITRATCDIPTCGIVDKGSLSVVLGTKSGVVTALCTLTGQPLCAFRSHLPRTSSSHLGGHADGITSMQWIHYAEHQRILVTAGRDGCVHFWAWPLTPSEAHAAIAM
eukprot:Protomagalhaensia_wolfi_Nauph_80__97@NODE_1054_length_1768_cov_14_226721_g798_i0_p3_GENE_NODE_1054_length_1768_cov_14_226721_g798_i0NODE_1054_length_1768_cov_14_226721_g798_i0_p3_ORF_typecomplete_len119_score9_34WD40/PF00400_32/5_7e03WD40/PF00400_32/0_0001ANAPC4_WD40/PF12894_7/0_0021Ge1_WD40/PF16529_5/0_0079_NODE_1054_length_1768_cov_14_226721_g798_i0569925